MSTASTALRRTPVYYFHNYQAAGNITLCIPSLPKETHSHRGPHQYTTSPPPAARTHPTPISSVMWFSPLFCGLYPLPLVVPTLPIVRR